MKRFGKKAALLAGVGLTIAMMSGCGTKSNAGNTDGSDAAAGTINVISREDGSGTRGAFIELFGIEEKDDSGEKVDMTTLDAQITNNTSVMMTSIGSDTAAIGYISLGSLNDTVKALEIDGAKASVESVKDGSYKVKRPFNIVMKDDVSATAQDFTAFILSQEGQKIVEDEGYIAAAGDEAYAGQGASGKVVVAGSSSVTPVMEKLAEAYEAANSGVEIEIQQSDSTTGITSANDGLCDIGMASRELKDTETQYGLTEQVIALDGIAVVVNNENSVSGLTSDQVKQIFKGEITDWSEIN